MLFFRMVIMTSHSMIKTNHSMISRRPKRIFPEDQELIAKKTTGSFLKRQETLQERSRKMRRRTQDSNPLLSLPRCGPGEAGAIFGWSGASFKRHFRELPPIRTVSLLSGVFYILEDVYRAKYPGASKPEIAAFLKDHAKGRSAKMASQNRTQFIGPREAALICGWKSPGTFLSHLPNLPKIRTKKLPRGTFYHLRDVFRVAYADCDEERLNELAISYREERRERLRAARKSTENHKPDTRKERENANIEFE